MVDPIDEYAVQQLKVRASGGQSSKSVDLHLQHVLQCLLLTTNIGRAAAVQGIQTDARLTCIALLVPVAGQQLARTHKLDYCY